MAPVLLNTRVPLTDEHTMIEPPSPCCLMSGTASLSVMNVPVRLMAMVLFQSYSVRSSILAHTPLTPASANTMSSRPQQSIICWKAAAM